MLTTSRKLGDVNVECTIKAQRSCPKFEHPETIWSIDASMGATNKAKQGVGHIWVM
jgi:hypothetical protein